MPPSLISFKSSLLPEKRFQTNLWDTEEYRDTATEPETFAKAVWARRGARTGPGGECYPREPRSLRRGGSFESGRSLKVVKALSSHCNGVGDSLGFISVRGLFTSALHAAGLGRAASTHGRRLPAAQILEETWGITTLAIPLDAAPLGRFFSKTVIWICWRASAE